MQSLIKIVSELAATASTLEKQSILTKYKDHPRLKYLFLWTYNPMLNYYVKKLSKETEASGKLSIDDDETFSSFGWLLGELDERKFTGHAALAKLDEFLSKLDKDSFELAVKVLFRDLRCNVTDTTANKIWKNLIPTFEVQLANTYDIEKPIADSYYASPKMDGLRGMFVYGSGLFTRQGKKIAGFDSLEEELSSICDKYNIGGIDGELFSKEINFEEIQGAVMRNKNIKQEDKDKIKFFVFALVKDFHKREVFETTKDMVETLDKIFDSKRKYLVRVPQVLIKNSDVEQYHDKWAAEGYEGLMLRSLKTSYDFKRSKNLLKFKKFLEEDFKMIDAFEGKGKYAGKLGGILVEGKINGVKISSEVGSGFNDEDREEYWKKKNELVGSTVEIKFQGVTPDGSLRFPVFNKFKLDR